jgi:precorrin-3B C17-methyltransferase
VPETVCGIVRNIGREGEEYKLTTLGELKDTQVDMFSTVFIGNTKTENLSGRMVVRRGYHKKEQFND